MESSDTGIAIGGILVFLFLAAIALAFFIFWIWMLIHALTNNGIAGSEKVAWVLLIFFASFIGSIIYFFVGRPKAAQARISGG